ncbi:hypothetical protein ACSFBM_28360 [Variovorax sp. GB1R11]
MQATEELPKKQASFRLPSISTTSGCGISSEIEQFQGLPSPHLHVQLLFETSDFDRPTIPANVISKAEVANGTERRRSFCLGCTQSRRHYSRTGSAFVQPLRSDDVGCLDAAVTAKMSLTKTFRQDPLQTPC